METTTGQNGGMTTSRPAISFTFLGVGGASQIGLGHASAVISFNSKHLLIDCGPGTTRAFIEHFDCLPDAVYITHGHLDHIGDFENLFIKCWFNPEVRHQPKVYMSSNLVPFIHERVGTYPSVLAEGGVNFWDAFHLTPVVDHFYWQGLALECVPVRHHAPGTAFGIRVPGAFFYTGDTRPIPEVMQHHLAATETIFHDCGVVGNPSHTGIDDLLREYPETILSRILCYHYYSEREVANFNEAGLRVVKQGESFRFELPNQ